jgi:hypothetical protein
MMMTALNIYFVAIYFLKTTVRSVGFSAHGARSGVTVTALGTQRMLISYVTCALIFKNMPGIFMFSHIM